MKFNLNKNFFLSCLGVLFWGLVSLPSASADITQGLDYLNSQQTADSSFTNATEISTAFQATSETLRTFQFASGTVQPGTTEALGFLNNETHHNAENLARLIIANTEAGNDVQVLITELMEYQNTDGGFGDFKGYDSTVLDTAFALEALAVSAQPSNLSTSSAVDFLIEEQLSGGGWAMEPNEPAVYLSALAMRALWHYRTAFSGVDSALISAQDYLLLERDMASGLWSETFESALALIAIIPNTNEFSQVESMVTNLRDLQQTNGSWDDGVYATALALRALASQPTPLPPVVTTGNIKGSVLDSITRQPIQGVVVSIDSISVSTTTVLNGEFSLQDLEAETYTLRVGAAGYSEGSISGVAVNAGVETSLGNILLAPMPTAGILQGQITNAENGQALAGVTVSVTGSSTASASTATNGAYSLTGLNPGNVTITLTLNGYLPTTATATIAAGNTIVYNPTLTPSSQQNEPLPGTITTGQLRGKVTVAVTGEPVAYAKVHVKNAVTGAGISYLSTGTDGSFEILEMTPGAITIYVSKSEYLSVMAQASVKAGNVLIFNPELIPKAGVPGDINEEPLPSFPTTSVLRGVVTDVTTGVPLESVRIAVDDVVTGQRLKTIFSSADGTYEITGLEPGDILIQVEKTGYYTAVADAAAQAGVALVFDPGLVPEGEDIGGDIEEEPMPNTPTTGELRGLVTDAETELPLAGVMVEVTGSSTASTLTNTDGTYTFTDMTPGEITVTVSLTDYLTVSGSGSITAGNATVFSPALTPDGFVGSETGQITGIVVEAGSNKQLRAFVEVSNDDFSTTVTADESGGFSVNDLPPGNYTLRFTHNWYIERSLSVVVSSGGIVDLQIVELSLTSGAATMFGQITDIDTGEPISEAVVSIVGTTTSTQTDSDGNYRIEGLDPGNKTFTFNATGYNGQTMIFGLPQPGEFEINRALTLTANTGLNMTFLSTDRTSYDAYMDGEIHANVQNNGSPLEAMVVFSLFNSLDELVSDFTATRPGDQNNLIMFESGVIESVIAPFNTANLPPGNYRIVGRVLVGNQMVGPATAILAELTTELTINETRVISQLNVDLIPEFSAVGVTETVSLLATLVNRSNRPVELRFRYDMISPEGTTIMNSSMITISVPPEQNNLSQIIDTFSHTFTESGEYRLEISFGTGFDNVMVETGILSVAPGLRIDPSQSVTPTAVTPDEDKRVRVNIRLEGMEVQ